MAIVFCCATASFLVDKVVVMVSLFCCCSFFKPSHSYGMLLLLGRGVRIWFLIIAVVSVFVVKTKQGCHFTNIKGEGILCDYRRQMLCLTPNKWLKTNELFLRNLQVKIAYIHPQNNKYGGSGRARLTANSKIAGWNLRASKLISSLQKIEWLSFLNNLLVFSGSLARTYFHSREGK